MWLNKARVPTVAAEMVRDLLSHRDIETDSPAETRADLEAVLNQYVDDLQDLTREIRDVAAKRGLQGSELGRLKAQLTAKRGIKTDEEGIDYVLDQLLEMLMHSHAVDEVYAPDHELRLRLRGPLRRQMQERDAVEDEVRGQMKHVQEGSAMWEVEYQRLKEQVLKRKGL